MGDWTEDDPRNECYPSAPWSVGERVAWVTARNAMVQDRGGSRAVAAAGGGPIGAGDFVLGVPLAKWSGMSAEAREEAKRAFYGGGS